LVCASWVSRARPPERTNVLSFKTDSAVAAGMPLSALRHATAPLQGPILLAFSRRADRLLYRHPVGSDICVVLAAQRHPVLLAPDRSSAKLVALHRRRVPGSRARRAGRRDARAAIARG